MSLCNQHRREAAGKKDYRPTDEDECAFCAYEQGGVEEINRLRGQVASLVRFTPSTRAGEHVHQDETHADNCGGSVSMGTCCTCEPAYSDCPDCLTREAALRAADALADACEKPALWLREIRILVKAYRATRTAPAPAVAPRDGEQRVGCRQGCRIGNKHAPCMTCHAADVEEINRLREALTEIGDRGKREGREAGLRALSDLVKARARVFEDGNTYASVSGLLGDISRLLTPPPPKSRLGTCSAYGPIHRDTPHPLNTGVDQENHACINWTPACFDMRQTTRRRN